MIKYIRQVNLKKWAGKTVILRIDLNIEPSEKNNSFRVEATLPTIKLFLKNKIRVILLSHRGRPLNQNRNLSLGIFAPILSKKLGTSIDFISAYRIGALLKAVKKSDARVILIENLRFFNGEETNDPGFAKKLASLGDFYVNEAFAVSHRKDASISLLPRFLPSYAGLRFEQEIKNLTKVMQPANRKKPLTVIIGGAKITDKIGVLKYFWNKADYFLISGGPANTFFITKGLPVGDSITDEKPNPFVKKIMGSKKIILPVDVKVGDNRILDIGPKTIENFSNIIKKSKTIIWNGPPGLFEKKGFENGSYKIAKAVVGSKAFSIVGGGETSSIIMRLKLEKKVSFLSTGGGAMLGYLSGEKLPGIEALK